MSPQAYKDARQKKSTVVVIDERPYFPFLSVDDNDLATVLQAATAIVQHECNVTAFADVQEEKPVVERLSGGITNLLFLVTYSPQHKVLLRVFGAEGMIDRDIENATFAALSHQQIAPQYWGRFANGRVEQFLEYTRPLQVREMGQHHLKIAKALANMHRNFAVPMHLQEYHPLQKPSLWTQLEEWLEQALQALGKFPTRRDCDKAKSLSLETMHQELQWLRETQIPPNAPVVFCHNDLLAANILLHEQDGSIQLIDFEYGGINYLTFDIANHFNEYAGGPPHDPFPNYEWLPSTTQREEFVRTYLTIYKNETPTEQAVELMLQELHGFLLANHLYWGLWAVNQAYTEGCESFDYMEYAVNRFKQYAICKQQD
ncbi:ethanolamine kinase [Fistulifera solaris]|uniref:ethanolamine kinase n=1 Tax=Fistulifera solaris TaxID=1519565 RepID=A0A1Z5J787_FISSO|nr:ethanolamine kinase [Fistulifera solaris]|eukprot:GAX09651.1 ethanolamine kinase [Fistulifera solaris]